MNEVGSVDGSSSIYYKCSSMYCTPDGTGTNVGGYWKGFFMKLPIQFFQQFLTKV